MKQNGVDRSRYDLSKKVRKKPMTQKSIQDVIDTMNDEQKAAVEALILCVIDDMSKGNPRNK